MRAVLVSLAFVIFAAPARAEIVSSSPASFELYYQEVVHVPAAQAWRSLVEVGAWWSSAHTYSGDAANLRLEPRAGGCWCERWSNNSVEHARVVMVRRSSGEDVLRLLGALGPLQEMGVTGVLTFTIVSDPRGAKITLRYRVSGDPGISLDRVAPAVDAVLAEQFARLARYTNSGTPNE